ncbi:MAG: efflux RND transporter periplasmic adaptor subunit [Thermosulfidibacteraceae bacterium]
MKARKKAIIIGVIIILLPIFLFLLRSKHKETGKENQRTVRAETYKVTPFEAIDVEVFSGRFEAKDVATLASKVPGFVTSVRVKEGDYVKRGTILATIDDREIRQNIGSLKMTEESIYREMEALKAKEEYARSNYNRYKQLLAENAVTQEEFERVKAEYEAIKNQINALKNRASSVKEQMASLSSTLTYTTIRAPFDGYVITKHVDTGTFVGPGTPIVTIVSGGNEFDLTVEVPEKFLLNMKNLEEVPIYVDALNKIVIGKIGAISPSVNPQTNSFLVKVRVYSSEIKNGMFGKLILPKEKVSKILIPENMIVSRGNIKAVYKVDNNRIVHFQVIRTGNPYVKTEIGLVPESAVTTGESKDKLIEVTGGLNEGDIIVKDIDKVREGDRLE